MTRRRVAVLPDSLINVIAAGEVIERPSSVVKELIENSLDAQATRIRVNLEDGGRRYILVSDDGSGMSHEDTLLAIERHATSKIKDTSDLENLSSLGFRGEALPTIAATGRFVLETWDGVETEGIRLTIDNGKLVDVTGCGRPVGTSVTLKGIFSRLPARRKFLRTRETEMSWCIRAIEDASLSRPDVQFELRENNEVILSLPPVKDIRNRISTLWGVGTAENMIELSASDGGISISGFISPPTETYRRRLRHRIMVNGRPVRDPVLNRVITSAISDSYPGGRFPALILSLIIANDMVDVNVHPAKREVRLRRTHEISSMLKRAVSKIKTRDAGITSKYAYQQDDRSMVKARDEVLPLNHRSKAYVDDVTARPEGSAKESGQRVILGQFMATYILCQESGKLAIVDQHAAHERIMYNQLMDSALSSRKNSQRLMVPLLVDLGSGGAVMSEDRIEQLNSFGFEIEHFGSGSLRITAVPADMPTMMTEDLFRQMALDLEDINSDQEEIALLISRKACSMSVKAGKRLSLPEMERLLVDLDSAENGYSCPHGRPTRISFNEVEIEKLFGRR